MDNSFTKIIDLLFLAKQSGVEVILSEERLQLKTAENVEIDEQLLNDIRFNKQSIMEYLASDDWQVVALNGNRNKISAFDRSSLTRIPTSFSQERLWFIDRLGGSVEYHSPTILRLTGKLNKGALSLSLQTIIDRHEVLRTVFYEVEGLVYQLIKESNEWELECTDGSVYRDNEVALQLYIDSLVKKPFNLAKDFPIRSTLISLNAQEYILVLTIHHIASDAWSTGIIVAEAVELYSAFTEERDAKLAAVPLQYADFSVWQRNYLQGNVLQKKITYWKNKLHEQQTLQLPADYTRSSLPTTYGASSDFVVDQQILHKLHEIAQQQKASLYMVLLAAFKVLLYRYSGQQDLTVGTSIATRQQMELEGLIGFFVNTLALRDQVNPDVPFTLLLQEVKKTMLGAYEHQDIPFEKVVEVAAKDRDPERNPLFQVMLVLNNTPESSKLVLGDVILKRENFTTHISKFEITFFITESPGGLSGHVDYRKDLFAAATINGMLLHYVTLLHSVAANPNQKSGLLPILQHEELQLLQTFNTSKVACPKNKTTVDLFEEQVAKTPNATAVIFEETSLTYAQLNERSNQLAHYLISKGIKPDTPVPLYMERSALVMVGIWGILKAGAAYAPIDTDLPADRIGYMLQEMGATMVVSSSAVSSKLEVTAETEVIEIDKLNNKPGENPVTGLIPHHLAYVIYTSGSTGRPKGVMIEHSNLVDYYYGLKKNIQIDQCRSFALVSTIATDLGNTVIYGSLLSGGALHLFSKESIGNIEYMHRYFREKEVDCVKIVPSHWRALRNGHALLVPEKLLVFGGEALLWEFVQDIQLSGAACRIVNHYGPTETTIGKLLHEVQPGKTYHQTIPIGRPFSNTEVYVLSGEMQPCPVGVPGQLYISGAGVARGYYKNELLTQEKFIADPFIPGSSTKMYRTGDLVKWLPDGNISFIGRVDDQVKIRGYRVEPGEIERILQQTAGVRAAVVLAQKDKQGNNRLVAYIVPQGPFDRKNITTHLTEKLPEYMIPAILMEIENLPLTSNGKTDRKALPDPDEAGIIGDEYVEPRNDTEAKMAAIWAGVLEVDEVGIYNDFFELGGHSLLAVRLISAIRKTFEVELPIGHVFDFPTVAALSAQLSAQRSAVVLPVIEAVNPRPQHITLSFSQERLWFIDRLEGSVQYHVPAVLRLKGKLNREALANALQAIVNRHEVLRTVIRLEDGSPGQYINEKNEWKLTITNGVGFADDSLKLKKHIASLISEPFNLSQDSMLRANLLCFAEDEHVLVAVLHHIASDGWSKYVLVKELVALYSHYNEQAENNLKALPVQYADYSIWQRNYLQGEVLERKLSYWKKKLEGVEALQLQTDYPRPAVWSTKGAIRSFDVGKDLSAQLQVFSQQHGVTLYMTLLSVFKVLLYRYSGQRDICVGTPVAGRQQHELEELIGFFVNTLALRSEVNGKAAFSDFLQQVKTTTLAAYKHQDVPFEKVVDVIAKERDMSRNPLFQVMFILRNTPEVPELRLGEIQLSPEGYQHATALFDIAFFLTETPQGLHGSVEYSTALFGKETIERLIGHYKELLVSILKDAEQQIGLLPMLTPGEQRQLLVQFNDTVADYPRDKTIINLFEEQVLKAPEAVAVVFEKEQITYQELHTQASRLARYLHSKGVTKETLVPICIERGIPMIAGILGILKAGAVFVPVDPAYPEERIRYMLEDTGAQLIVSNQETRVHLQRITTASVIELDGDWDATQQLDPETIDRTVKPGNLAYVIYTSGSTGKPKGVMIEHSSVVNVLNSLSGEVNFTAHSSFLSVTTYSFDISYLEFFMPLTTGGKLIIVSRDTAFDGFALADNISRFNPTHLQGTPATWQLLLHAGWKNNERINMLIGGEAVKEDIKEKLAKQGSVWNVYGPTETTIWSTVKQLKHKEKVTIGKPVDNTGIYIVSMEMQLCPIGVAGEICISGNGLARGYLNRPDLTAEKFIPNPFGSAGERLYKTGDLGKWLSDGNLECFGRIDNQVKIRGYRIELEEIERALQQTNLVNGAMVFAKEDKEGFNSLISYYVPDQTIIKEKESSLYEEQVTSWKHVYETEYTQPVEATDEEFDTAIWKDSVTGDPIPREQMEEWLDDIIQVIKPEQAGEVLEIGCGTGLIYYQLAGKVKKYTGTDISQASVNLISSRIGKALRNYGPTQLQVGAAHEVLLPGGEQVDTIILNSVVQYFPGESYMSNVIGKCLSLLKKEGRIIIGDVRDNRLLEMFKRRIQLQKLQSSVSIRELMWTVDQEVLKEEELCFSPDYFYHFQTLYPQITAVEILLKQATYINELSSYRYTVIIHVGHKKNIADAQWQSLDKTGSRSILHQVEQQVPVIALQDVPNPRLWQERAIHKALQSDSATSLGDLLEAIHDGNKDTGTIEEILATAQSNGYHSRFLIHEDPLLVNILLEKNSSGIFYNNYYVPKKIANNSSLTNVPLFKNITLLIQKEIRAKLQHQLPEYMVPSEFVALHQLPLTANGKRDRLFLSMQVQNSSAKTLNYQAAGTEIEKVITAIWQNLLGVDRISIHDNFFELGGHSLSALKLVWQLQKKMNINMRVNDVFIYPTVADLAGNIVEKMNNSSLPVSNIKYLVPVKTSGSKPPLYFVAGGGGTALKIKNFAYLLHTNQPVYVFQPPFGIVGLKEFPDTIEEIAAIFIKELLVQNPTGPYALSGHCLGGIIAFEMAQQLQAMGKKVHLLTMFDTIIRKKTEPEPGTLKNLYHIPFGIKRSVSRLMLKVNFHTFLLRKHTLQSIRYRITNIRTVHNKNKRKKFIDNDLEYAGLEIFDESSDVYMKASKNYKLHQYNGDILLFYATDRYFFFDTVNNISYKKLYLDEKTKKNWKDYATNISIYEIKGEHSDIFDPIHGEEFANTLQRHLDNP